MATDHPDYAVLGGRVAVSMLHNKTKEKFSDVRATFPLCLLFSSHMCVANQVIQDLYTYVDARTGRCACLIRFIPPVPTRAV
jgi:hypothetical protein